MDNRLSMNQIKIAVEQLNRHISKDVAIH